MPEDVRTLFAQRGADIADAFAAEVSKTKLTGPVEYHVELMPPDGPSTGGGTRSIQHLRLVPHSGTGAAIVVGTWDQLHRVATLRSWELLSEQYAQRFKGAKLPVDAVAYGRSLQQMETFFLERSANVERDDVERVTVAAKAAPPTASRTGAPSAGWMAMLLLVGIAVGLVAGAALMYTVLR